MYRIGEFSRLARTTVKTLRYYDEVGLLKPEGVDPFTGYRHYTTRQLYNRTLRLTKDSMEPHAAECVAFAKAVHEGLPSPVPPEQSLQVLAILDGIYRSQAEGREIALDLGEASDATA